MVDVLAGPGCIGSGRRLPDAEAGAGIDGADGGKVRLFDRSVMVHQQVAKVRRLKEQLQRGNATIVFNKLFRRLLSVCLVGVLFNKFALMLFISEPTLINL